MGDEGDGLLYRIETWGSDDRLEKLLAKSSSIVIARAALTTAIAEYPSKKITLRQGVRVIDGSEQRERESKNLRLANKA
jgi:hypothetical protein